MPNWIEGTLKLRGTQDDLRRFLQTGIDATTVDEFCSDNYKLLKDSWIRNTRRVFVSKSCSVWFEDEQESNIICIPVKQAWTFSDENWVNISREYNLDIRLFGFESGQQFCKEVEIIGGDVTISREITYDDWKWECPMPELGG